MYQDGVLINTYNNQLYPDWTTDWNMVLGKWAAGLNSGNEREMDGIIDDFRIYNKALDIDEINNIMLDIPVSSIYYLSLIHI